ncbi:O-linked N-acetylglucosamine transferase, SPINDLY family protein [Okeania sp. SIO2B3]|uniref:O-linked N-acetylglucosamine transferase, SPINDLY family protein n=1 Tax=Okeania sp. SIO2B3 TaxID=2607784 RepID=UPI0013C09027|nr:O-linked N-acetylglucosamine transferase, SPINDLY family protein [Okeania sp. SIO2B3]NET41043.1 O-linked N-acetylglucosamine transferase, SPINDLY family protein [Okeania sp. SIO2B3]
MISDPHNLPTSSVALQHEANECLLSGDYAQAISIYEEAIQAQPECKPNYWYLGLSLLLQGQETEAQTTWLFAMADGDSEEIERWTSELAEVLQAEGDRQENLSNYSVAWAIRQHLREIAPTNINNLLHLLLLSIKLEMNIREILTSLELIEMLQAEEINAELDSDLLLTVLRKTFSYAPIEPLSLELTAACVSHVDEPPRLVSILLPLVYEIAYSFKAPELATKFCKLGLRVDPQNLELLRALASFYIYAGEHAKAIETAKLCYSLVEELPEKIYNSYLLLKGIMSAGSYEEEVSLSFKQHELLIKSLIEQQPIGLHNSTVLRLYSAGYFFPYFRDKAETNLRLRNQIARVCQANIEAEKREKVERYRHKLLSIKSTASLTKRLKIGYVSHCLRRHSVGWLTRWIFQYHNREKFEIHAYLINSLRQTDHLQEWYLKKADVAYQGGLKSQNEIAEQINQDEIDILIDLDSITLTNSCEIMALKAAAIQVSWLGWDASGIPTIDYFIADPYVLPESAQDYYQETIWRLPQTYIAINGFEVDVPTLRREDLEIPGDAVVYFSTQRGFKHHPQTTRWQMKIIKEVPNSFFLIKSFGDKESLNDAIIEIAEQEGVSMDRLRFLPEVPSSEIHRANLGIADIVLDTYPYNGATTTLETLWMCIPMVTRVGQQFAARNSYTMMMNAGITEGIAWSDEEYVEWGIRLGKDEKLRQEISWKLRKSRQTAPLWNAKQFTREMEKAYEQMWQRYIEGGS